MSRASTIGAVVLASSILIGGSVFSVYAINSSIVSEDAHLPVVQTAASAPSTLEASPTDASGVTASDLEVSATDEELIVPDVPAATPEQTLAAETPGKDPADSQSPVSGRSVNATTAQRAVLRSSGGQVLGTWAARHGGFSAYAIKVKRTDGSIIVGYVDRATGTVYDWTRLAGATTKPSRTPSTRPSTASRVPSADASDPSDPSNPSDDSHSEDTPAPDRSSNPENSGHSGQSDNSDQSDD